MKVEKGPKKSLNEDAFRWKPLRKIFSAKPTLFLNSLNYWRLLIEYEIRYT